MKKNNKKTLMRIVSIIVFGIMIFNASYFEEWSFNAIIFLIIPLSGYLWDFIKKENEPEEV
jgi:hypothetical protein